MAFFDRPYFYSILFSCVIFIAACVAVFFMKKRSSAGNAVREEPFSGGFPTLFSMPFKVLVSFGLKALIFVLFMVQMTVLLPFALTLRSMDQEAGMFVAGIVFLWISGYVYAYGKGAL